MKAAGRGLAFAIGACVVFALLVAALSLLPEFGNYPGPYGDLVMSRVEGERHTGQGVAAVTFDYRGADTMGEEFILFSAVAGVVMLLRRKLEEHEEKAKESGGEERLSPGPAVVTLGTVLFPVGLVYGVAMVLHGHLTPGGGFQGGVLCASAFLFAFLTGELEDLERLTPEGSADLAEACGAAAFVVTGLAGLAAGGSFLFNFLPLGETGKLLSAGFLPLLNVVVGLEVCGGFLLILTAFLRQTLEIRRRSGP